MAIDIKAYDFNSFCGENYCGAVNISIVRTDDALLSDFVEHWLSARELNAYHSFNSEKRKQQYAMGRIAAKNAIMQLTNLKIPREIDIFNAKNGNPLSEISKISITHSRIHAAAIASTGRSSFGIDVERIDADKISALSCISLKGEPINTQDCKQLTVAWCMKEALSKALLRGLKKPFETLRIKTFQTTDKRVYFARYKYHPRYKCIAKIINSEEKIILAIAYNLL